MEITPDARIMFEVAGLPINATIFNTWIVMVLLTISSALITWRLQPDVPASRWRTALEVIVTAIEAQIAEVTRQPSTRFIPFIGTLFLFIAVSNLLLVVPGFDPPTASLSTTTALALTVLVAVPAFGIASRGLGGYLKTYL
ncbi:MAG: F0F1 ATP synthase subunit A, partial [Chromatiales bacterium]